MANVMKLIPKQNITCKERLSNTYTHCKFMTADIIADYLIIQNHFENTDFKFFLM